MEIEYFYSMSPLYALFSLLISVSGTHPESGLASDSSRLILGTVYNRSFEVLPGTHVVNMDSREGTVCNNLGIFKLMMKEGDHILFRNISYRDSLISADLIMERRYVKMERAIYLLEGARIFEWGSTYQDFSRAIISMPNQQSLGEQLKWPRADPNHIPFEMNEQEIKSIGFLLTSPISYMYQNYNKKAKSARKVFWDKRNKDKIARFNAIVNAENIADITGLSGERLLQFMEYLSARIVCDYKCGELKIYEEIFAHWGVFQKLYP